MNSFVLQTHLCNLYYILSLISMLLMNWSIISNSLQS